MSRDIILAAGAALSLGAGMIYLYKHDKGQGQQKGATDTCLARCTCGENKTSCERHDAQLINELRKTITKWDMLTESGILLGVKISVIETIQEDNRGSINNAALKLLQIWYQKTEGLRKESKDLKNLKKCMEKVGLSRQVKDIMDRHFDQ